MIWKTPMKFLLILFLLLVFQPPESTARFYNTLYWMNGIPQANYGNLALAPQPNFYIGLPIISSMYGNFSNQGFKLDDLLRLDMYNEYYWDSDNLLSKLKDKNHLQASFHVDLLSFGFRNESRYFTFHVADKFETNMSYSQDLMYLMVKGTSGFPADRLPGNFDGIGTDYHHYREYAAGIIKEWSPAISTSVRAKLLTGFSNTSSQYKSMKLQTATGGNREFLADILVNSTNNGIPELLTGSEKRQRSYDAGEDAIRYLTNTGNLGAAFDLGLFIKPSPSLSLSLSVLDLGFISWEDNAENVRINGSSRFEGIDLQDIFDGDIAENFIQFADTSSYGFQTNQTSDSYRQTLAPRFYASAALDIGPRHQLSLLANGLYYNDMLYPSASLTYRAKPSHAFGIILSYTVANLNYSNIGFGFNMNLGPVQLYAISDNVLAPILPYKTQMANIHVGMNLVFGYRPPSNRPSRDE